MSLSIEASTNVAIPLFEPGYDSQYVRFDADDKLYLTSYINDLVTPPKAGKTRKLYNCKPDQITRIAQSITALIVLSYV